MNKNIIIVTAIVLIIAGGLAVNKYLLKSGIQTAQETEVKQTAKYWTCGMHPSVRISDKEYRKGTKNCPICNMPLTPVKEQEPQISPDKPQEKAQAYYGCGIKEEGHCPYCDEGKTGTQCICGKHSFLIKTEKPLNCPICKKPLKKIEPQDLPAPVAQGPKKPAEHRIVYYRNPMHPEITSKVPAKDEMGMDFIPVYEDEIAGAQLQEAEGVVSRVNISRREAELAGVAVEPLKKYQLTKTIRTVGKVAFDPQLSVAQEEFLTAVETSQKLAVSSDAEAIKRAEDLVEKSKFKLRLLGMSDEEIAGLEKENKAQMNLVLPEDKAWVYAEVYEYELGWLKPGQEAIITVTAYPGEEFKGLVKQISPVLNPMTRSATARIEVDNLSYKLKPQMYADVIIKSIYLGQDGQAQVLAIPKEAVLDTGIRKVVYIEQKIGIYLGKEVKLGPLASVAIEGRQQQMYPLIKGLSEGDKVVTKANFLLDSQSQLSPAVSGAYGGALETKEQTKPPPHQH